MTTDTEKFAQSQNTTRWGYQSPFQASVGGVTLIEVQLESDMARRWTVNLLAPRSQGGNPRFAGIPFSRVQVEYGVAGATELALVDYPINGGSFSVNAARVRVAMASPPDSNINENTVPVIGAFIAPCDRDGYQLHPTLTQEFDVIQGADTFLTAPARAVGYRLIPRNENAAGVALDVREFFAGQDQCIDRFGETDLGPDGDLTQRRAGFTPLHPNGRELRVSNVTGSEPPGVWTGAVQWLLDLG